MIVTYNILQVFYLFSSSRQLVSYIPCRLLSIILLSAALYCLLGAMCSPFVLTVVSKLVIYNYDTLFNRMCCSH